MKAFTPVVLFLICFSVSLFAGETPNPALQHDGESSAMSDLGDGNAKHGNGIVSDLANQFGVEWKTLIPQMINFVLVAIALYYLSIKPVSKKMAERQQKIADGLQYAEEMKVQLAEAERERAAKVKEAAEEAQRILSEAREQSKELIEKKAHEAAAQAEAIIRKAGEANELDRQKMLSDVRQEVARLVVATSSKVLSRDLSDDEKTTFAETATQELASIDS